MTKTAFLFTLVVTALASVPAQAQQVRAFVSGHGLDTNPCTLPQPCRTFQQAFNTVAANGMIWVLDPAGYQPLTITHGITIQAGGMGAITVVSGNAITISVTTSDPVMLNGLVLDGGGTGTNGINITSGPSVQIFTSVIRHFQNGINYATGTNGANLLVEDTTTSDNGTTGINVTPSGANVKATLNRITANNNLDGVDISGGDVTIANSVLSNNSSIGLGNSGTAWLAKNVISGNPTGVFVVGTVNSYQDNYIRDNMTPVGGGVLTPVGTQ
jgi:hypothetical protein